MPRWLHIIVQILLLSATTISTLKTHNVYIAVTGPFLMGVVAIINQAYNTDGTPQSVPCIKSINNQNSQNIQK